MSLFTRIVLGKGCFMAGAGAVERKERILPKEVLAVLSVCDEAVAESNSLADLVGRIVANGLNRLIKG